MIALIRPLPAGNALQIYLEPANGAVRSRLLRKTADTFTDEADPAALVVHDGDDKYLVDTEALTNGVTYFYRLYSLVGLTWVPSATVSAQPDATYQDRFCDAQSLVRERLELGLLVEKQRGNVRHNRDRIPVLTAPPLWDESTLPVVSVHMQSDAASERGIGEVVTGDFYDMDGDIESAEGWLSRVQLLIIGWCLNPDERIALRQALRRVFQANLPVFDRAGLEQIDLSFTDTEDFQSYSAPVYMTTATFSCLVATEVAAASPVGVVDVIVAQPNEPAVLGMYLNNGFALSDGTTIRLQMSYPPEIAP